MANPQSFNRFSYVLNNPIRFTDPTGNRNCAEDDYNCPGSSYNTHPITPHNRSGGNSSSNYFSVASSSSSSNLDLMSEFWNITGLTPKSTCDALLRSSSNPLCNPNTYNLNNYNIDIGNTGISMPTSGQITTGLNLVSQGVGITDALKWTKWPIVSIVADAGAQWNEDNGKGYNGVQRVVRAGVVRAGEGQLASQVGLALAGVDSIPGAITGPGDVIIIGGSYLIGSNATSFWFDVANNTVARYAPPAFGAYFPQTLLPYFDRSAPGNINWCYSTFDGGC